LTNQAINKSTFALLLFLCSALFYAAAAYKIPISDDLADSYFSESIQTATIAYATARGVNAVVSVIKESELDLSPAGVGVTIAAGQILDPIDDMTERLSSVLVAAIASLGIQKIGFEISVLVSFKAIALLLLLCIPLLWRQNNITTSLLEFALKACFILLLLRFMLPVSALVSDGIYKHWLQPNIETSLAKLALVNQSYEVMSTNLPSETSEGFFASLTDAASDKVKQTQLAFTHMVENVEQIITSLLSLMTTYLAIFAFQIVLLPLLMLWLLLNLLNSKFLDGLVTTVTKHLSSKPQSARRYINHKRMVLHR